MKEKTLLLSVHCNVEGGQGEIEYAVLIVDEKLAERAKKLHSWVQSTAKSLKAIEGEDFYTPSVEVKYFDSSTYYCSWPSMDDESTSDLEDKLDELYSSDNGGYAVEVKAEARSKMQIERVECNCIHVCDDGLYWTIYPKHGDIQVRTSMAYWSDLELS